MRSVLNPEERNELLEAQRTWLKYRDLTCTAEYHLYDGGTGGPVTRFACLSAVTQERVATLKTTTDGDLRSEAARECRRLSFTDSDDRSSVGPKLLESRVIGRFNPRTEFLKTSFLMHLSIS
jgi:uncharacterized protein YecT (DUF1311 family)